MPKTILADVSGFTPVIDRMAMEHGLVYAAVFGRMWRFCQMEDGVCKASLDKIASGLHIDKATVMRYANRLVEDGYLKDLTPDLRNAPHVYADTGKASIRVGIGATVAGCNAEVDDSETVAQCNATVAGCNATVAQSKLKIVSKKHSKDTKEGILHPDFDSALAILKELYPSDYAQAAPILIEADDHPYRLHIRLEWMTPDFIDRMSAALREVNPRRNYCLTYQTNGTGRSAEHGAPEPAIAAPDPYEPTETQMQTWRSIIDELSFDVQPNTRKSYIDPARPISINGSWTIAVPSPEWWQMNVKAVKRIYKALTGEATEFVFVEQY